VSVRNVVYLLIIITIITIITIIIIINRRHCIETLTVDALEVCIYCRPNVRVTRVACDLIIVQRRR